MSIELVMPSNHLIFCHPLFLPPSIFPSIRVFSCESVLRIRRPKYWSFSFTISPSNEYSGLVSFRIDWFNLLAVQGTLKSTLSSHQYQHSHHIYTSHLFCDVCMWAHKSVWMFVNTFRHIKKIENKCSWVYFPHTGHLHFLMYGFPISYEIQRKTL